MPQSTPDNNWEVTRGENMKFGGVFRLDVEGSEYKAGDIDKITAYIKRSQEDDNDKALLTKESPTGISISALPTDLKVPFTVFFAPSDTLTTLKPDRYFVRIWCLFKDGVVKPIYDGALNVQP